VPFAQRKYVEMYGFDVFCNHGFILPNIYFSSEEMFKVEILKMLISHFFAASREKKYSFIIAV